MACLGSGKDRGSILGSGNVRRSFGKLENNFFFIFGLWKLEKRGNFENMEMATHFENIEGGMMRN